MLKEKSLLPVALLNTSIATADGSYELKTITLEEARKIIADNRGNLLSAIGHQSTAEVMSTLLKEEIEVNRIQFCQKNGQIAIVFKLNGRPPEGKILTAEEVETIGYKFQLLIKKL